MKILVSGSTGFVGSRLVPFLREKGHNVTRLVRSRSEKGGDSVYWDPSGGIIESGGLEGHDAVIHLAGENIAGRWTEEKKARIMDSRVRGTALLVKALIGLNKQPEVIVAASGAGYYGDRGDEILTEESGAGRGFLAEVSVKWEDALVPASGAGIRVAIMRTGMVLSPEGGALEKMLLPFKLGLGGRIGSGEQYWSWITLQDMVRGIYHILTDRALEGPVNMTAPNPVTNREFTEALAGALGRPAFLPVPAFVARGIFGEMADELMLASTRVIPARLEKSGFRFESPELGKAFDRML